MKKIILINISVLLALIVSIIFLLKFINLFISGPPRYYELVYNLEKGSLREKKEKIVYYKALNLNLKILTILAFIPNIGLAESQDGGLPQMDVSSFPSQIFWLIITFGALYIFMWKNAVPKLRNTIEERRDKIAIDLNEAEKIKSNAEEILEEYEHKMSNVSKEANNIISNAKLKADTILEDIKKDQEKKLNDALEAARIKINNQETESKNQIEASIIEMIKLISSKYIDTLTNDAEIKKKLH